jgi:hypothetical protein
MTQLFTLSVPSFAVIIVAGYSHNDEGEFIAASGEFEYDQDGDRKESLGLHQNEIELIKAVAPVNPNTAGELYGCLATCCTFGHLWKLMRVNLATPLAAFFLPKSLVIQGIGIYFQSLKNLRVLRRITTEFHGKV